MSEPARSRPELRVVEDPEIERLKRIIKNQDDAIAALQIDKENLETELVGKRRIIRSRESEIRKLKAKREQEIAEGPAMETIERLCDFHKLHVRPHTKKYGPKTIEAVRARLMERTMEGEPIFPPRYIAEAILGAKYEAYVSPGNGKRHDFLELICRDADHLTNFHERYERHKARSEQSSSA